MPQHCPNVREDLVNIEVKPAELGDHMTSCTMRLSIPTLESITVSLDSEDSDIAYPISKNVTFLPDEATSPKVIYFFANSVGETFINVNRSDSSQTALSEKTYKLKVIVVHSLKLREVNVIIGWIYFIV